MFADLLFIFVSLFHRINSYTTAIEDIAGSQENPRDSNEKQDTGCTVIPTDANDPILTIQSMEMPNDPNEVSQALINFSANETQIASDLNASKPPDDLMKFDQPFENQAEHSTAVKTQSSDCSVITLSTDGSGMDLALEISNKSIENEDEEMFERSISCPPKELQDDLFEDSSNDEQDQMNCPTIEADNECKTQQMNMMR